MKLDYSSLDQPLTKTEIDAYKAYVATGKAVPKYVYIVVAVVMATVVGISVLPMIAGLLAGDPEGLGFMLGMLTFFAGVVAVAVVVTKRSERRKAKLYRFAVQNGIKSLFDKSPLSYTGMVFDEGHSRKINEALVLPDGTEVGNYEYVTGSGKNRSTHTYGYLKIPLTRNLPHMVLDGKANNFLGFTGMTDSFDRSQKLSLEGDFDNHFTLYAPKEYERDALYVFTPDVMQVLIDEGKRFDMEIIDNELYAYSNVTFDLVSQKQLMSLVKIIETVGIEIRDQTKRYADERVAVSQGNTVAPSGRRLNKGLNWTILLVLAIIAGNIIISVIDADGGTTGAALYIGIGIAVWVGAGVAFISRIKLR